MSQTPPLLVEAVSEAEAERITAQLDTASRLRKYTGPFGIFIMLLSAGMSIFHLYTTFFGFFDAPIQRAAFFIFVFVLGFALYPARFKGKLDLSRIPPWYDLVLMALSAMVGGYIIVNFQNIVENMGNPTQMDIIMGSIACLLVLELCRRAVGPVLTVICIVFIAYALWGNLIPGFLSHRGYPFTRLVSHMYLTTEGLFGVATGVATTYVFMFILFGAFLLRTGTGQFFIDFATALLGSFSGGPAKVAVFSSALMGTINGSSVANVVGTGSFTIPLMKSIGYKPYFAGAVEAAASTGGQLMPPVMGAGAFIMAEILGIPYTQVIIAAALPAILYYTGVLTGVHLEAKRTGLEGIPRAMLPSPWKILKERGLLLLPIVAVVYMLMNGYTPPYAAIAGIITSIICGAILPTTRVHPMRYWEALVLGARDALGVSVACIAIGFIMGSATLTGAGLKIANGIILLSGGNLFFTLFFTMIASLILGMGLPTTANYLVTSTIAAPALVQAGVPLLPAHLFVFYFGIIADLTPPVALAAMAGAGLAGAPPTKTGLQAFRLAAPAYLIPYVFCYAPQITLLGYSFLSGVEASITAVLGVITLGVGLFGWMRTWVPWWQRILLFGAALLLITPGWETDLMGFVVLAAVWFHQRYLIKSGKAKPVKRTSTIPGEIPSASA